MNPFLVKVTMTEETTQTQYARLETLLKTNTQLRAIQGLLEWDQVLPPLKLVIVENHIHFWFLSL